MLYYFPNLLCPSKQCRKNHLNQNCELKKCFPMFFLLFIILFLLAYLYITFISKRKIFFSIWYRRGIVVASLSDACTSLDLAHTIRWLCTFHFLHEKTFLAKFAKIYSPKRTHAQFKKNCTYVELSLYQMSAVN